MIGTRNAELRANAPMVRFTTRGARRDVEAPNASSCSRVLSNAWMQVIA
jgi:hypothetical protein